MNATLEGEIAGALVAFPLEAGTHRVGRDRHCDLRLSHVSVSRDHAEILAHEGRISLRDLGSRNGTWVNGRRIENETILGGGDSVRFGSVELILRGAPAAPASFIPFGSGPASGSGSPSAGLPDGPASGARPFRTTDELLVGADEVHTSARLSLDGQTGQTVVFSRPEQRILLAVAEAGRLLVANQPLQQVFEAVMDVVERMVRARRVLLLLNEVEGELPVVHAARPPVAPDERILLSRTLVETVVQQRQSLLITDASQDERFREQHSVVEQNIRAALVAPLFDEERVIGLIYADTSDPRVLYDQEQLQVLTLLANLIAVKITTTRLLERQREMELMEQELNTAARIQTSLLPATLPEEPGYEIFATQTPSRQVGGDLYEVARRPDGRLTVVVGDVSGKGMGAALLMSNVSASLRVLNEEGLALAHLMRRLNQQVFRSTATTHFVTLFLGFLDGPEGRLDYVNGGHNPPLLLLPDGTMRELESTGLPVGLFDDGRFETAATDLPPGSLLCVFSDGITEAARDEDFFGEERLAAALRARFDLPLAEISAGVLDELNRFLAGGPAGDDMTLLLLRRLTSR